jgi:hypothetical protein
LPGVITRLTTGENSIHLFEFGSRAFEFLALQIICQYLDCDFLQETRLSSSFGITSLAELCQWLPLALPRAPARHVCSVKLINCLVTQNFGLPSSWNLMKKTNGAWKTGGAHTIGLKVNAILLDKTTSTLK